MPFDIRYLRPVQPVAFPPSDPEWDMSEGTRHSRLCEILARILRQAVGLDSTVGADQFVYFDASDPKRKCAPDAFLKLGVPQDDFPSWKTWKGGVPEVCVEILSSDGEEKLSLKEKLRRFHTMGVSEVVVFNADKPKGKRLRAWDWIDGDLVERVVEQDRTPCRALGKWFVVAPCLEERESNALRLSDDAEGHELVSTLFERAQAELAELKKVLVGKKP